MDIASEAQENINWRDAHRCIVRSSRTFDVHPLVIKGIMLTENGRPGMANRNSNGTYDLGPMQINTINVPALKRVFRWADAPTLRDNTCANIIAATYLLNKRIEESGSVVEGVGNYHSKTKKYHNRYLDRFKPIFRKLVKETRERLRSIRSGSVTIRKK